MNLLTRWMSLRAPGPPSGPQQSDTSQVGPERVAGERGIPSIHRARSLQSRLSNLLAMGLMVGLGAGLLGWYYAHAFARQAVAHRQAMAATQSKAQGDMALPSLGPIDPPTPRPISPAPVNADPSLAERILGPAPLPLSPPTPLSIYGLPTAASTHASRRTAQRTADRRLQGPVFAVPTGENAANGPSQTVPLALSAEQPAPSQTRMVAEHEGAYAASGAQSEMASLLTPTLTATVQAQVLPSQTLLLPKGAFIDCTLETAIDSSLPGMTTCITATDTFGADGKVVLLERGTKLVGETRGVVQQGSARVFVLWTEARTPTGVVVPLASPGTDELGRSGLSGAVNRHFWERFGAAMLISVINGGVQAAVAAHSNGGAVIYDPSASTDVLTGVLKSTVNIPPTVTKQNGDRIQVLVARDLDFRSVYQLRAVAARP